MSLNKLKKSFLIAIGTIIILIIFDFHLLNETSRNGRELLKKSNVKGESKIYENYKFILNNNVLQYSSYIVVDQNKNEILSVESLIQVNFHRINTNEISTYSCIVKFDATNVIHLNYANERNLGLTENRKITCSFKTAINKENLDKFLVAIIRDGDFGDLHEETSKLPYFMLKFQKPSIVYVFNPRLPAIG